MGSIESIATQFVQDVSRKIKHGNSILNKRLTGAVTQTALLADTFSHAPRGSSFALAAMHPLKGLGYAEDVAGPAVFLASQDAQWITGIAMAVDGGYTCM